MTETVNEYYSRWNPIDHTGYVRILWTGGSKGFSFSSTQEFEVVIDLLRNEKPMQWDSTTNRLYAWREPVGEEED